MDTLNHLDTIKTILTFAGVVATIIVAIIRYVWKGYRMSLEQQTSIHKQEKAIASLSLKQETLSEKITLMEHKLSHTINIKEMSELKENIANLQGILQQVQNQLNLLLKKGLGGQ